ncbi:glycosyltransferase family 87 protein [Ovoidimarina sediminis]|uniref:glycosyltransferase family 87 protein n=1 Tax=Ovoidimarina sediminis TaxID=3079856 RepID=UPI002910648B|nr:glycosyltransferase family 87 protein [Rhodophyticola sp. MJ-SS7]MDU8946023.1 glycosyltransferase family 87 protein [Rhodophyticola sp. MJ-SS7]
MTDMDARGEDVRPALVEERPEELPRPLKVYPKLIFIAYLIIIGISVGGRMIGVGNFAPFIDFIAFYSAAELTLEGNFALAYDDATLRQIQGGYLGWEAYYAPWFYPPTYMFAVFWTAFLPLTFAGALFFALTALLFAVAVRPWITDRHDFWIVMASPVIALNALLAQNGLLIAGLCLLAVRFLDRRPFLAGAALAAMTVKPHLGVLWPVFLLARAKWRVIGLAVALSLALIALSAWAFGTEGWIHFFQNGLLRAREHLGENRLPAPLSASILAGLTLLGAPLWIGITCHVAVAVLIAGLLVGLCRAGAPDRIVLAFLMSASLFVAPHSFTYDWALVLAGSLIAWKEARRTGFLPYEVPLLAVGHFAPIVIHLAKHLELPVAPVLLICPVIAIWRRARHMANHAAKA